MAHPVGIAADLPTDCGLLVKDNDPLSLAMAMEKILNDLPFDPTTLRKFALHYSEQEIRLKLNELYTQLNG